jgi:hypothetical protein
LPNCFPEYLLYFILPIIYRAWISPYAFQHLLLSFYFINFSGCEVVFHCGFDTQFHTFSSGIGVWTPGLVFAMQASTTWVTLLTLMLCSLASCKFFLEECLFRFFVHFKNWIVFSLLNCKSSLHILDTSDTWFTNTFSHSMGFLFTFMMISLKPKSLKKVFFSPGDRTQGLVHAN